MKTSLRDVGKVLVRVREIIAKCKKLPALPEDLQRSTVPGRVRAAVLSGTSIPPTMTLSHGEREQSAANWIVREVRREDTALGFAERQRRILTLDWGGYLFSKVGTSRCDVRAACSGATPSMANVPGVPPA